MCFCFNEMSQTAELYTLGHCGTESYSSVLTLKTKGSLGRWKKVETCQTRWAGFRHWFGNFSGSDHRYAPVLFSKSLITCNISSPAEMFGVQTKLPHLRCWSSGSSLLHEGLGRVRSGMIHFGIFMPIITVQVVSGMQHVWVTFIELSANLQLPHAKTFVLWKCTHTKTLLHCSCWMLPQKIRILLCCWHHYYEHFHDYFVLFHQNLFCYLLIREKIKIFGIVYQISFCQREFC